MGYSTLLITAANREENENLIRKISIAMLIQMSKDDYQIIITTEVLAEGNQSSQRLIQYSSTIHRGTQLG